MSGNIPIEPIEPSESARIQRQELQAGQVQEIAQEAVQEAFTQYGDEAAFNPVTMSRRYQTLEEKRKKPKEGERTERAEKKVQEIKPLTEISDQYAKKYRDLDARSLLGLRSRLSAKLTPAEILREVLSEYSDYTVADYALDFLIETSEEDVSNLVKQAKEDLHASHGRETRAGRNIEAEVHEYSDKGLGTSSDLRNMYREITGNPRDAATLFSELSGKLNFNNMKTVIAFVLHSLGADLRSKGPSISRAELHRIMTEGRNMQAILWVYRFFQSRMRMIQGSFHRSGLLLPAQITFEFLAKLFVQFLLERYPTMDKVLQLALKLGISVELLAQIILFTQMRDAIRGISPRLFKSEQHRHDVLMAFIEALEELEEQLDEEEEKG